MREKKLKKTVLSGFSRQFFVDVLQKKIRSIFCFVIAIKERLDTFTTKDIQVKYGQERFG